MWPLWITPKKPSKVPSCNRNTYFPRFEQLEDRRLLALVVSTISEIVLLGRDFVSTEDIAVTANLTTDLMANVPDMVRGAELRAIDFDLTVNSTATIPGVFDGAHGRIHGGTSGFNTLPDVVIDFGVGEETKHLQQLTPNGKTLGGVQQGDTFIFNVGIIRATARCDDAFCLAGTVSAIARNIEITWDVPDPLDLIALDAAFDDENALTYEFEVKNAQGLPDVEVGFYRSSDDALSDDDILIDTQELGRQSNGTHSEKVFVGTGTTERPYTIVALDPNNIFSRELTKDNNEASAESPSLPRVEIDGPSELNVGEDDIFIARAFDPDDGTQEGQGIVSYEWVATTGTVEQAVDKAAVIKFDTAGTHDVVVVVTDNEGQQRIAEISVDVVTPSLEFERVDDSTPASPVLHFTAIGKVESAVWKLGSNQGVLIGDLDGGKDGKSFSLSLPSIAALKSGKHVITLSGMAGEQELIEKTSFTIGRLQWQHNRVRGIVRVGIRPVSSFFYGGLVRVAYQPIQWEVAGATYDRIIRGSRGYIRSNIPLLAGLTVDGTAGVSLLGSDKDGSYPMSFDNTQAIIKSGSVYSQAFSTRINAFARSGVTRIEFVSGVIVKQGLGATTPASSMVDFLLK